MVHVASSEHGQAEVADDERRALETGLARRATASGIRRQHLGLHLPGRHLPGGYTWDLALDGDDRAAAAQLGDLVGPGGWPPGVMSVDAVLVEPVGGAVREPAMTECVKRTLLLSVEDGTPGDQVAGLEADLLAMPRYVPAIRNWSLAHARPVGGTGRWTHVWEQEYRDLDGLLHDYMESPFHWGVVDQWFYVGGPTRIVKQGFAHVYCRSPRSVLAWS